MREIISPSSNGVLPVVPAKPKVDVETINKYHPHGTFDTDAIPLPAPLATRSGDSSRILQSDTQDIAAVTSIDMFLSDFIIPPPPLGKMLKPAAPAVSASVVSSMVSLDVPPPPSTPPPPPPLSLSGGGSSLQQANNTTSMFIDTENTTQSSFNSTKTARFADNTNELTVISQFSDLEERNEQKAGYSSIFNGAALQSTASMFKSQEGITESSSGEGVTSKTSSVGLKALHEKILVTFASNKTVEIPVSASTDVRTAISISLVLNEIQSQPEFWSLCKPDSVISYPYDLAINKIPYVGKTEQFSIRRIVPETFQVSIQPTNQEPIAISVSVFTTGMEALELVEETGLLPAALMKRMGIWKLTMGGAAPRFVDDLETPFVPKAQNVRFLLKEKSPHEAPIAASSVRQIVKIYIEGGYFRGIVAKRGCTAHEILSEFLNDLKIELSEFQLHYLYLATKEGTNYTPCEKDDMLHTGTPSHLMYKTFLASLDDIDSLMNGNLPVDNPSGYERASIVFPSIEDIRSILTSLAYPSSDQSSVVSQSGRNSVHLASSGAKIADMLGVNNDMDINDVKSRLTEIYGDKLKSGNASEESVPESTKETASTVPTGGKRIGKLTNILGIDSETELAQLLLQSSRKRAIEKKMRNRLISDADDMVSADEQRDKSVKKLSKILGVNGEGGKAPKKNTSRKNMIMEEASRGAKKMFARESILDQRKPTLPAKPFIINGSFGIKVYLMNQTYKSISVPQDMTASRLAALLVEKLNIRENVDNYGIYVDKKTEMTPLKDNDKIYDIMSDWTGKEILLFRRNMLKEKEIADDASIVEEDVSKTKRRAAKVANILGFSENKNTITEADNPEIKAVVDMLNSTDDQNRYSQSFHIEKILKEGWLLKEEGDIDLGQSKTKNCWCYIENGTFHAKARTNVNQTYGYADPVVVRLKDCRINRLSHRKNGFEIRLKNESAASYVFYADSVKSCDTWMDAMSDGPKESSVPSPLSNPNNEFKAASEKVSMSDFEIRKVLGRGKFGKVLQCVQKSTGKVYAVKVIKKSTIKEERQLLNSKNENRILRSIRHPFIVSLYYAFQTPDRLHLVMEYVNGGELFFHVNHFGRFSEERVRFYAAEIFLALQCLHGKGIVYRDLKLENILLDHDGHVKITDFGLSKHEEEEDEDENVISGTSEYLAPEVLGGLPHSYSADWWAYAIVVFEMLCGFHPFYCEERDELFHRIMYLKIEYPRFVNRDARDFLVGLLQRDPNKRLGSGISGTMEIQSHPFFETINFHALFNKQIEPPFKPDVVDDFDVSYFDEDFTELPPVLTPVRGRSMILGSRDSLVSNFTYNGDLARK